MKCCYCGKEGNLSEGEFILGSYSHNKCTQAYFTKQEKHIKHFRRKNQETD